VLFSDFDIQWYDRSSTHRTIDNFHVHIRHTILEVFRVPLLVYEVLVVAYPGNKSFYNSTWNNYNILIINDIQTDPINQFNPVRVLWLSNARTSHVICHCFVVVFVFSELIWEVIVRFVDIGEVLIITV